MARASLEDSRARYLALPPRSEDSRGPSEDPRAPARKPLILVVDDDDALREALCEGLELEGFRTLGAIHGLHALALLEAVDRPDVIILDLMMPVMNGWDLHARLKANPVLRHIPVLVLSSYVRDQTHTGPQDVECALQKPIRMDEFIGWVRRLARRLDR